MAIGALALSTSMAYAADTTLVGMGKCENNHRTALEVEANGKTTVYHLVPNDVSKAIHAKICPKAAKLKVTGEVQEVDGKMQLTATKIEVLNKDTVR